MLPKISVPRHEILIPSKEERKWFRPFLVKEEKILLMAGESGEEKDIIDACKQIILNCCLDEIDINKLAVFDLEYLFLKLRAVSVNNICKLSFKDLEDEKDYDFEINLDEIELTKDENHNNIIDVTDEIKIKMKYPTVDITDKISAAESQSQLLDQLVISSIESIYDSETVYEDYTEEELVAFLDSLEGKVYNKIREFFETMPRLYHVIKYKNSKGSDREIELRSIKDFFTWA